MNHLTPHFHPNKDGFCHQLRLAIGALKNRLLAQYESIAPERSPLIRAALAQAEVQAWKSPYPHLLFPDLAEIRLSAVIAPHERIQRPQA